MTGHSEHAAPLGADRRARGVPSRVREPGATGVTGGAGGRASLSAERYIAERVDDQLRWYEAKSAANKRWYHVLQLLTLVLSATIPVLSLSSGDLRVRIAVATIGALTTVVAGLLSLYRFREQWIDYRATAEALKYERYLFLVGAEPYAADGAFPLFARRVESIIRDENHAWREKGFELESADESPASARRRVDGDGASPREGRRQGGTEGSPPHGAR